MSVVEISRSGRGAVVRIRSDHGGIAAAHRVATEVAHRLGDALSGTVTVIAPRKDLSLAGTYLVRTIENLVFLEGGRFHLVA